MKSECASGDDPDIPCDSNDPVERTPKADRSAIRVAACVVGLIVTIGALAWLAQLLLNWIGPSTAQDRIDVVVAVAQALGGFALLGGLFFTYKTVRSSQESLETQRKRLEQDQVNFKDSLSQQQRSHRETLELQLKAQRDERFFKAAELLSHETSIDARIAALFALEQLARESEQLYSQIIEVICTYVRRASGAMKLDDPLALDEESVEVCPEDIFVAVQILGRRPKVVGRGDDSTLNLQGAYLCKLHLKRANLQRAELRDARLIGTVFDECNLVDVAFNDAYAQYSGWYSTILVGSSFVGTDVRRSKFYFDVEEIDPSHRAPMSTVLGGDGELRFLEPSETSGEPVNGGEYLGATSWASAELDEAYIGYNPLTLFRGLAKYVPIDLSGMYGLTVEQWESFSKPRDAVPPQDLSESAPYRRSVVERIRQAQRE